MLEVSDSRCISIKWRSVELFGTLNGDTLGWHIGEHQYILAVDCPGCRTFVGGVRDESIVFHRDTSQVAFML